MAASCEPFPSRRLKANGRIVKELLTFATKPTQSRTTYFSVVRDKPFGWIARFKLRYAYCTRPLYPLHAICQHLFNAIFFIACRDALAHTQCVGDNQKGATIQTSGENAVQMTRVQFGGWLRQELEKKSMTRRRLAQLCVVEPSTVGRWVSGKSIIEAETRPKLAKALGLSLDELPDVASEKYQNETDVAAITSSELIHLYTVRDGIPDHALIELADETGFFAIEGFKLHYWDDTEYQPDIPYPALHNYLIKNVRDRQLLLSAPPEAIELPAQSDRKELDYTNTYRAYALITLANKSISQVYDKQNRHELFVRLMLEMTNRGLFNYTPGTSPDFSKQDDPKLGEPRIAWLGKNERRWLQGLYCIYGEISRKGVYKPPPKPKSAENGGLVVESHEDLIGLLDEAGTYAKDIIVGDAFDVAVAIANEDRYKILLTLLDIKQSVLRGIERYPETRGSIEAMYRNEDKDCRDPVGEFSKKWQAFISELESTVHWMLIGKDVAKIDPTVVQRLNKVIAKVRQYVTAPSSRHDALRRVCSFVEKRRRDDKKPPTFLQFERAWELSYDFSR